MSFSLNCHLKLKISIFFVVQRSYAKHLRANILFYLLSFAQYWTYPGTEVDTHIHSPFHMQDMSSVQTRLLLDVLTSRDTSLNPHWCNLNFLDTNMWLHVWVCPIEAAQTASTASPAQCVKRMTFSSKTFLLFSFRNFEICQINTITGTKDHPCQKVCLLC